MYQNDCSIHFNENVNLFKEPRLFLYHFNQISTNFHVFSRRYCNIRMVHPSKSTANSIDAHLELSRKMKTCRYKQTIDAIENYSCTVATVSQVKVARYEELIRILINKWIATPSKKQKNIQIKYFFIKKIKKNLTQL